MVQRTLFDLPPHLLTGSCMLSHCGQLCYEHCIQVFVSLLTHSFPLTFYFEVTVGSYVDVRSNTEIVSIRGSILHNDNKRHNQEIGLDAIHQPYSDFTSFMHLCGCTCVCVCVCDSCHAVFPHVLNPETSITVKTQTSSITRTPFSATATFLSPRS